MTDATTHDLSAMMDQMDTPQAPAIPKGTFVAAVLESGNHDNPSTGSVGYDWRLSISLTPGEYDPTNTKEMKTYTWLGYYNKDNPAVPLPSSKNGKYGYAALGMIKALTAGLPKGEGYARFDPKHNAGRLVRVTIDHEESTYEGETRVKPVIRFANPFRKDDEVAPRAIDPSAIVSTMNPPAAVDTGSDF